MEKTKDLDKTTTVNVIIENANKKSTGVAILLTVLFGPLGLFYASVSGAIVLLLLSIPVMLFTLGLGGVLIWIASIVWGILAVAISKIYSQQKISTHTTTVQG